jgi:hypothetical protein
LRSQWLDAIAPRSAAAAADEEKWYASVVVGLESVVRTLEPAGVTRDQVLEEFRRVR